MNSSKKSEPSKSQPSTSKSFLRGIVNSKANPHHNSMKLWRQLNLPESTYDLFQPNVFSLPEKLLKHSAKLKPLKGPHQKKSKKGVKSKS
jgi:hypothetical protein